MAQGTVTRVRMASSGYRGVVTRVRMVAAQQYYGQITRVRMKASVLTGGVDLGVDKVVEPFSVVEMFADVAPISTSEATSYTWTQESGIPVAIIGTGATVTFEAPASKNSLNLSFKVVVTFTGRAPAEDTIGITTYGHGAYFKYDLTLTDWVPIPLNPAGIYVPPAGGPPPPPPIDPETQLLRNILALSKTTAVKMAMLGSSTTAGNNATTTAKRYVNLLSDQIRTFETSVGATSALNATAAPTTAGLHTRNGGVGGTTSANYVDATRHGYITTLQPQICTHMVGSNDYGFNVNPATFKTNVQNVMNAIDAEVTAPVLHILIGAYQRMDVTGTYPHAQYGAMMGEIAAASNHAIYIDLNPAYVAVGIPGSDPLNYLDTDNLHQTDAGHAFMANLIFNALDLD